MPAFGRSATFKSEREQFDRRRAQSDLMKKALVLASRQSQSVPHSYE